VKTAIAKKRERTALDDEPTLSLTKDQYLRLEQVWYAIGELSEMIDPPKSEGGRLICLGIVNDVLGDVIHELEPQIQGGVA
jgi:hypothetical protein